MILYLCSARGLVSHLKRQATLLSFIHEFYGNFLLLGPLNLPRSISPAEAVIKPSKFVFRVDNFLLIGDVLLHLCLLLCISAFIEFREFHDAQHRPMKWHQTPKKIKAESGNFRQLINKAGETSEANDGTKRLYVRPRHKSISVFCVAVNIMQICLWEETTKRRTTFRDVEKGKRFFVYRFSVYDTMLAPPILDYVSSADLTCFFERGLTKAVNASQN